MDSRGKGLAAGPPHRLPDLDHRDVPDRPGRRTGESPIYLDIPPEEREIAARYEDGNTALAVWVGSLRELFPFLDLRIRGDDGGVTQAAEDVAADLDRRAEAFRDTAQRMRGLTAGEPLHAALDAYVKHLKTLYGTSGYGRTQRNIVETIKGHVENQSLGMLTADRIEAILAYFANRPLSKKRNRPLARTTCRNVLISFRQFLRWLNRSEAFRWEMPRAFSFPRCKIKRLPEERIKKRKSFKLSELKLLWQYALAWDRALIVLALNCGFSKAEIATLQAAEVHQDSRGRTFVSRHRHKTEKYGEWLLWDIALERRTTSRGCTRAGRRTWSCPRPASRWTARPVGATKIKP